MSMSSTPSSLPNIATRPITEKLRRENFLLWSVPVLPAIRGAQLLGFLDGIEFAPPKTVVIKEEKVSNPEYITWLAKDQNLLGYLNTSLLRL